MIKLAICDDEAKDREGIREYIREFAETNQCEFSLKVFGSAEQFQESNFVPDILFLDILMDKMDGIQLGSEIKKQKEKVLIIYTTNLKEEMAAALNQIHSFGYLLKPIEKGQLFQVLEDAVEQVSDKRQSQMVTFLSENNTYIQLPVMDIYYFEYLDRKIRIVTKDAQPRYTKDRIKNIADKMKRYGFIMSHQSFVVNLYYIDRFGIQSLIMKNGDEVFLAQKRASKVRKVLMQLAKETVGNGGRKQKLTDEK